MSKEGSEFYENFTKDIYETIKGMNRGDRGDFIISTYENLYGKLKTDTPESGIKVDMKKLREDLGHIRGIGGQRLDEIMAVIEKNIFGADSSHDTYRSPEPDISEDTDPTDD